MSAGHGLNFIENLADTAGLSGYENLVSASFVALLLMGSAVVAKGQLKRAANPVVPDKTLTLRNFFELIVSFIVKLGDTVMGKQNRKYLPFAGTVFIYVLAMNMIGLLPGFSAPTDHAGINVGIAAIVFILYTSWGVREVGPGAYLKHMCGPVDVHWAFWALAPFLLGLELISHLVRPATLTLRLFGNMTADHTVLSVFTELTRALYIPVPVIFYLLGTLVCFIQAFVFFVLTMVYISLAVTHTDDAHGDEGEHAHGGAH